jgi:uncharacterized protein involved in exopolysaccharide biosynthesis
MLMRRFNRWVDRLPVVPFMIVIGTMGALAILGGAAVAAAKDGSRLGVSVATAIVLGLIFAVVATLAREVRRRHERERG